MTTSSPAETKDYGRRRMAWQARLSFVSQDWSWLERLPPDQARRVLHGFEAWAGEHPIRRRLIKDMYARLRRRWGMQDVLSEHAWQPEWFGRVRPQVPVGRR